MADFAAVADGIWPKASAELTRFVEAARENADLLASALYTIRDWLRIAGYEHETLYALLLLHILGGEEGSLCTELSHANLSSRLRDLVPEANAGQWAERILVDLGLEAFPRLIGSSANDDRPLIIIPIKERRYLYFQKFLRHEDDLAQAFKRRLAAGSISASALNLGMVMDEVLRQRPLRLGGQALRLDPDQRAALELGLTRNLVLISGGPGTGKTSIVLTLLRCLVRSGVPADRIALAAPTGRAAQRLGDALRQGLDTLTPCPDLDSTLAQLVPTTVHKLLEYHPAYDSCRRHAENPLEADVVIVDEVSMVGLILMARLLEALRPDTRLILLGDKDQLPSVEAGAVLAHLIPSTQNETVAAGKRSGPLEDAVVILRTNHRSEPELRLVAAAINEQEEAIVEQIPRLELPRDTTAWDDWQKASREGGCRLLELTRRTPAEIRDILRHWATVSFLSTAFPSLLERCRLGPEEDQAPEQQDLLRALFQQLERARLLTLVREGPWGCNECNRFLEQTVRSQLDRPGRSGLFVGAPVLVTRNDPPRQLYNGDVGLTVRNRTGDLRVAFQRQGRFLIVPPDALPPHELGFALTVHKSQGSEYEQVMVVLPPEGGRRLLTKELVYTAITRAKKLAVVCATPEVLRLAISRKCAREAGLLRFDD